jgi:hypothetical protein
MGTTGITNKHYYTISQGRIRRKGKKGDEGVMMREKVTVNGKGTGEYTYEYLFKNIYGMLKGIRLDDHPEYGTFLVLEMEDVFEIFEVQLREKSAYGRAIMSKLPNLDLNKEVKFQPYNFIGNDNKRKIGCRIEQDGTVIYPYYIKKEEDNSLTYIKGYPNFKIGKDSVWDQDEWNKYLIDVHKFLRLEMKRIMIPKFKNSSGLTQQDQKTDVQTNNTDVPSPPTAPDEYEENDAIPF